MVRLNTEKIDLDVIGEELERSKEITTTGVVFRGWRLEDLAPVLRTAVVFSERLPDTERHRIINLALFEAGRLGKLCRKSIITALGRLEAEYLSASPQTFVLATTVSADFSDLLRPVKVHGATVAFSRWLPERFDRSSLSSIPEWPETPDPFDFMSVRVSVKARTKFEAIDRGSEPLDFIRALWNYSITRGTLSRHSMGRPAPVNQARLGPVQTLHHPDGSLVDANLYWYQIDYHDSTTSLKRHEWARILREFSSLRRAIARVKYAPVLYDVFVRYARALDGSDFEAVFLKLWSILELL